MEIKSLAGRIIPIHLNYHAHIIQTNTPEFLSHYYVRALFFKDYKCFICGTKEKLQLHHIVPTRYCGKHRYKNICVLCSTHHKQVENGDLIIPFKGKVNQRLVKKINKILLKYYREYDQELIGTYPREFIFNHLSKNNAIKEIIKMKPERLPELKARLMCESS